MANQVICDIVAAEKKAEEILAQAHLAASNDLLRAKQECDTHLSLKLSQAKNQAKEKLIQQKEFLGRQTTLLQEKNKGEYEMIQKAATLRLQDAADFIVERIIK